MSGMDRQEQIEYIFDHYQHPRNRGEMADADVHVQGGHEGCADIVTMYLKFDGEHIADVSFTGEGCTISQASASVMTEIPTSAIGTFSSRSRTRRTLPLMT